MWVVKQFSPSTNLAVTGVEVTPVRDGLPFPPCRVSYLAASVAGLSEQI
jgi:hypothetical protein